MHCEGAHPGTTPIVDALLSPCIAFGVVEPLAIGGGTVAAGLEPVDS